MLHFLIKYRIHRIIQYATGAILIILCGNLPFNPGFIESFQKFGKSENVRITLAVTEVVAALLFAIIRTTITGGIFLLGVFAYASWLHLSIGESPVGLLPWTVAVILVMLVHLLERRKDPA